VQRRSRGGKAIADTSICGIIPYVKEISVFLKNVPGQLEKVADKLSSHRINIRGMTVEELDLYSIVRLICDDNDNAIKILEEDFQIGSREVLEVNIENKPGALARLAKVLGSGEVNIEYCYVALSEKGNSTVLIVKVNNVRKAKEELLTNNISYR
jgi:hypothetical protein